MNHKILLVLVIGVVIGGIFAIGTAISYFRDQDIKAILESENMTKALAQSDAAMESSEKTMKKVNETLEAVIRNFD